MKTFIKAFFKTSDVLKQQPTKIKEFRLHRCGEKYCITAMVIPTGSVTVGKYTDYEKAKRDFEKLQSYTSSAKQTED